MFMARITKKSKRLVWILPLRRAMRPIVTMLQQRVDSSSVLVAKFSSEHHKGAAVVQTLQAVTCGKLRFELLTDGIITKFMSLRDVLSKLAMA